MVRPQNRVYKGRIRGKNYIKCIYPFNKQNTINKHIEICKNKNLKNIILILIN